MSSLFLWLSGASTDLLDQCKHLSQSERTRFTGIGSLVLIPAVLGFVSMAYAISTVSSRPSIFIAGGFIWFLIVLAIDRYAVSTLFKSAVTPLFGYGVTLVSRYVMAILIGIAVSHPLVLFYFDQSISQRLDDNERKALDARVVQATQRKAEIRRGTSEAELSKATDRRDCLQTLLTAEQSGVSVQLSCGYSSGIPDCGSRCEKIDEQISAMAPEIDRLAAVGAQERGRVSIEESTIGEDLKGDLLAIRQGTSRDYLARVDALAEIEREKPHVGLVK